jgi:hypothetical protein
MPDDAPSVPTCKLDLFALRTFTGVSASFLAFSSISTLVLFRDASDGDIGSP